MYQGSRHNNDGSGSGDPGTRDVQTTNNVSKLSRVTERLNGNQVVTVGGGDRAARQSSQRPKADAA